MSKSRSQIRLVSVLGAVLGGVLYMQRETYFGVSETAEVVAVATELPIADRADPIAEPPAEAVGSKIELEHLIGISPFKQSGQLRRLFEPDFGSVPAVAGEDSDAAHFVSHEAEQAASESDMEMAAATASVPQPQVEAVFTDRSGRWRAVVDSQRVGVGDALFTAAGEPYAEVLAIDAAGVDIRLLDEAELQAVDSID